jgi:phage shock protein A
MTDDKRLQTQWPLWLLVGIGVLLGAQILLAATARLFDLAITTVVVMAVTAAIVVALRLRAGRHNQPESEPEGAPMWQSLKRWWNYLAVKLRVAHEEHADPKVQLEQAILEARAEHRRLSDAAALVVAQQKQAQDRLDAKVAECEKAKASAGQALLMIDREARLGHTDKVATFTTAAEGLANRVLGCERDIREAGQALLQATSAAEQAKAAVVQNATALQAKLDERERLLSVLDRAKMQEALNNARGQLDDVLADDVPSFAEVERKIHNREAVAHAKGELSALQASAQIDPGLLEIEAAQRRAEAQALLVQMRERLGLPAPVDEPAPASPRMLER